MDTSIIQWTVYDGSDASRPQIISESDVIVSEDGWEVLNSRKILKILCLLQRAGSDSSETQAFCLSPIVQRDKKDLRHLIFKGWEWISEWHDPTHEDPVCYPLAIGDAWAEWPARI